MNEERYYELDQDTVSAIENFVETEIALPVRIDFQFLGDKKLKDVITVKKISPVFEKVTGKQVLITVNEDLYSLLDQDKEAVEVILREAFNTLEVNPQTSKIKILKNSFNTSPAILKKYGADTVIRVKQLIKETADQLADKGEEEDDSDFM